MKQCVRRRLKIEDDVVETAIMIIVVRKKKKTKHPLFFCFPQYWAVTVANKNTFYNESNQLVFFFFF